MQRYGYDFDFHVFSSAFEISQLFTRPDFFLFFFFFFLGDKDLHPDLAFDFGYLGDLTL